MNTLTLADDKQVSMPCVASAMACETLWQRLIAAAPVGVVGCCLWPCAGTRWPDYLFWHVPDVPDAVPPIDDFLALAAQAKPGQWQAITAEESPLRLSTQLLRLDISQNYDGLLVLAGLESALLSDPQRRELAWLALTLGLNFERQNLASMLEDLQRVIPQQVVWMESFEWLKGVTGESPSFYRDLVSRTLLLTNADSVAIFLLDPDQPFQWYERGFDSETCQRLETWILARDIVSQGVVNLSNAHDSDVLLASVAYPQLLVIPLNGPHFQSKGLLLLGRHSAKPVFDLADEMLLNQLLAQVSNTLERNTLLSSQAVRQQELLDERAKQQALIEQLQATQTQLIQSEKLASIGQLAAGVAHEINNPIGYVNSNLTRLGQYVQSIWGAYDALAQGLVALDPMDGGAEVVRISDEHDLAYVRTDLDDLLTETREGIERVKRIVEDLKDFSRADAGELGSVQLDKCIEKTLNIVRNEIKYKAEVIQDFDPLPPVELVESQISQVVMNLLVNAGHAMESPGTITVSLKRWGESGVRISVADTGCGIAPANLAKIFDPFYTSKPVGQGTGLGLSISYGIVQRHHGRIDVDSTLGVGTTFHIYLPLEQPVQEPAA